MFVFNGFRGIRSLVTLAFLLSRHTSPEAGLAEALRSVCPGAHEYIGAGEQHIEAVQVLPDPAIHSLGKSELPLDDQKGMPDHASYGRFPVPDLPLPIDAREAFLYIHF